MVGNEMAKAVGEAAKNNQKQEIIDAVSKIASATYDQSSRYANTIIVAGYASYFALLSATKDIIDPDLLLWSATALALSVTIFVFFEVYKMLHTSYLHMRAGGVLDAPDPIEMKRRYEEANRRAVAFFVRVWIFVLATVIPTALAGIGILFWSFMKGIVCTS